MLPNQTDRSTVTSVRRSPTMGRSLAPRPSYESGCGSLQHQASGGGCARWSCLSLGPESPFLLPGAPRPPHSRLPPQSDTLRRQLRETLRQRHGIKPPVSGSPDPHQSIPHKSQIWFPTQRHLRIFLRWRAHQHTSHISHISFRPTSSADGLSLDPST